MLINPRSGPGKALSIFDKSVAPLLDQASIRYDVVVTSRSNHARDLICGEEDLAGRWTDIVIVSGDGLLFEMLQGIFRRADWQEVVRKVRIGIVAGGSGAYCARFTRAEVERADASARRRRQRPRQVSGARERRQVQSGKRSHPERAGPRQEQVQAHGPRGDKHGFRQEHVLLPVGRVGTPLRHRHRERAAAVPRRAEVHRLVPAAHDELAELQGEAQLQAGPACAADRGDRPESGDGPRDRWGRVGTARVVRDRGGAALPHSAGDAPEAAGRARPGGLGGGCGRVPLHVRRQLRLHRHGRQVCARLILRRRQDGARLCSKGHVSSRHCKGTFLCGCCCIPFARELSPFSRCASY